MGRRANFHILITRRVHTEGRQSDVSMKSWQKEVECVMMRIMDDASVRNQASDPDNGAINPCFSRSMIDKREC